MALVNPEGTSATLHGFGSLPMVRQIGILVSIAVSIALGVAVVMWSIEPNYRPLYSNISTDDASSIIDVLQQSGIAYKLDRKRGTILVDGDDIHDARIKLAAEGLPRGEGQNFDFLGKSGALGGSQFMENARYRHALEAELARTISNFQSVKSARVHLAIPKQSVFLRDKRKPTASVFVDVYSGSDLSPEKVSSIVHLVASSIPSLDSSNVTVVDNHGNLLTDGSGNNKVNIANRLLQYRQSVENSYVDKIQDILVPLLGPGKVKARVSADIDFTASEQTRESYNPDLPALRSEQMMEENKSSGSGVGGVPGALSNSPSTAKKSEEVESAAVGGVADSRRQSTKNYELDKTISHTKMQPGIIKRLTVAVVVDDREKVDAQSGKVTRTPLDKQEIEKITTLVRDAIGYNVQRGDSVNVINSTFAQPPVVEALPEASFYQQNWFFELIKQVLAAIFIFILIFAVLRPLMRYLASSPVRANARLAHIGNIDPNTPEGQAVLASADPMRLPAGLQNHQDRMQAVQGMAVNDPKRVAQVVKTWVDN